MQVDDWHSLVPLKVAERFVNAPEGGFKHPSTTSRLTTLFPSAGAAPPQTHAESRKRDALQTLQGCAAFLIGDAAHVFPPGTSECPSVPSCDDS